MLLALQLNNLLQGGGATTPILLDQIPNVSAGSATGTHAYDLAQYFVGATSYAIAPALETGWSFDTGTGLFTIDTDANGTFGPYTVTATNASGDTASNPFTVKVAVSKGNPYSSLGVDLYFKVRL